MNELTLLKTRHPAWEPGSGAAIQRLAIVRSIKFVPEDEGELAAQVDVPDLVKRRDQILAWIRIVRG